MQKCKVIEHVTKVIEKTDRKMIENSDQKTDCSHEKSDSPNCNSDR